MEEISGSVEFVMLNQDTNLFSTFRSTQWGDVRSDRNAVSNWLGAVNLLTEGMITPHGMDANNKVLASDRLPPPRSDSTIEER